MAQGALVSRAVCRNCWTWYIKGETVCPHCGVPLVAADAPTPTTTLGGSMPASALPSVPATRTATVPATGQGFNWTLLLPIGIIAIVAIIAVAALTTLNLGGPAVASDGHFSVKAPRGWSPTTLSAVGGRRVVLALAKYSDGEFSNFSVMDFGQLIPLSDLQDHWGEVVAVMKAQTGKLTTTAIGGRPALTVDLELPDASGQLLFVDYGDITYMVMLRASPSQYEQMRNGDFAAILSSWQWR